jgi:hypothetical protein
MPRILLVSPGKTLPMQSGSAPNLLQLRGVSGRRRLTCVPDIIELIKSMLYLSPLPAINVIDTSKLHGFPADMSIADYLDEQVPYGM